MTPTPASTRSTPVPTLDTPGPRRTAAALPRRRARRAPAVPPMPRRLDLAPADAPVLHTLHGPWTVTVSHVRAGAPPLTVTTW